MPNLKYAFRILALGLAVVCGCERPSAPTSPIKQMIIIYDLTDSSRKQKTDPPYFEWHGKRVTLPVAIIRSNGSYGFHEGDDGRFFVELDKEQFAVHFPNRADAHVLLTKASLESNLDGFPGLSCVSVVQLDLGLENSQESQRRENAEAPSVSFTSDKSRYDVGARLKSIPLLDLRTPPTK